MKTSIKGKIIYLFFLLVLAAFLILKVQRGFTASEEQGGIWNIIQGFFVCSGLYVCFILHKNSTKYPMIKWYKAFMFTTWFMALPVMLFNPVINIGSIFHFIVVPYGLLCFLLFYRLGLTNDIRKYPYILYPTFLIIFYMIFIAMQSFYISANDKGAVADVYYIVGLLPIIFIYTPSKLRIVPFLLSCIAVMMTSKRTGFLALATIFIFYFLPSDSRKRSSFFLRMITIGVLLIISYYVITRLSGTFDLNMFDRLAKLDEDGGSGRAERWELIWDSISIDQSVIHLLLGHGYGAANKMIGGHVHNDFLEFFYDYGIIVLIMYILLFVAMVSESIKMYKSDFIYAREFVVAIIVSLFLAMFSFYAIDCTHITCCSVCLGLILAEWYKFQNNIIYE